MTDEKIQRINELARRAKAEGLTQAEREEQAMLRQEFLANVRGNLRAQLNNISIENEDGTITNLGKKFGNKGGH